MDLRFRTGLAGSYTSIPQAIRVMSEAWVHEHVFCPNCGRDAIERAANNRQATDFHCAKCGETFELKSKNGAFGPKIVDGAYSTMLARLRDADNPNLFLLNYNSKTMSVSDLCVVPKHFFTASMIEPRKPLAVSARRAGWVGCLIKLDVVPDAGRISIVRHGDVQLRSEVISKWQQTLFLREQASSARGWLLTIMALIERLAAQEFSLAAAYEWEGELRERFPNNRNIRPKIRQQLQVLRDQGFLSSVGRGLYRVTK